MADCSTHSSHRLLGVAPLPTNTQTARRLTLAAMLRQLRLWSLRVRRRMRQSQLFKEEVEHLPGKMDQSLESSLRNWLRGVMQKKMKNVNRLC